MRERFNGTGEVATLEAAAPLGWQAAAVGEYERSWPDRHAELRADLCARILELTGRLIASERIYTDGNLAVADVEGVTFRLYHRNLVLVRTCTYCETGHFESPEISSISDLGYALSAFRPLHEDCEVYSSEEIPDF